MTPWCRSRSPRTSPRPRRSRRFSSDAGIESEVHPDDDSGSLKVFVAEASVEAAQDVIEPPTDPTS